MADRVEWLLGRGRYKDALEVFEGGREGDTLGKWTRREIGVKFIEHLVEEGQWEEAAEQMPRIYGHDAKLWEKSIFQFAKKGHLKVITQTHNLPLLALRSDLLYSDLRRKSHHMFRQRTSHSLR
jgi:hypothetical protein